MDIVRTVESINFAEVADLVFNELPDDPILKIFDKNFFINSVLINIINNRGFVLGIYNNSNKLIATSIVGNFTKNFLYRSLFSKFIYNPKQSIKSFILLPELLINVYWWLYFSIMSPRVEGVELAWIVVDKKYKRKGYGTNLLKEVEKICKYNLIEKVWLKTLSSNSGNISFYKKNLFLEVYRDPKRVLLLKDLL